jgi:hypothetical protein
MALRNAQGQRGKYLTRELSRTRNPVEDMYAIVSKFQSAKIGVHAVLAQIVDHFLEVFRGDREIKESVALRSPSSCRSRRAFPSAPRRPTVSPLLTPDCIT